MLQLLLADMVTAMHMLHLDAGDAGGHGGGADVHLAQVINNFRNHNVVPFLSKD